MGASAHARHRMLGDVARGGRLHVAVAWSRARRGRRPRRSGLDTCWWAVVHGRVRATRERREAVWARVSSVLAMLASGDAVVRADGHGVGRVSAVLGTHLPITAAKQLQGRCRRLARAFGRVPSVNGASADRRQARTPAGGVDRAVGGAARHSDTQGARGGAARRETTIPNESTRERLIRKGQGVERKVQNHLHHRHHPQPTVSNVGTSGEMPVNNRARTGKIGGRDLSDVATPATELDSRNNGNRRKNLARAVIQPSGYMTRARFQRRIARLGALLRRLPRARQLVIMAILRDDMRPDLCTFTRPLTLTEPRRLFADNPYPPRVEVGHTVVGDDRED